MFDRLGRSNDSGVQPRRAFVLRQDFVAFGQDAVDPRAGLSPGFAVDHLEDRLKPHDLAFGLSPMLFEGGRQLV